MMMRFSLVLPLLFLFGSACAQSLPTPKVDSSKFTGPVERGALESTALNEVSGLAASVKNKGALWVHNDSGGEPKVYLIDTLGKTLGSYVLVGAKNRDWEDIAVGPGPKEGETYVYVGEIGDNDAKYPVKRVYRFVEPTHTEVNTVDTIQQVDQIQFVYPDGRRDAETLLLDPLTKDLYIISKRDQFSHIYQMAYPQDTSQIDTLEMVGHLSQEVQSILNQPTGGDIAVDGLEVLIKSYVQVYYWQRENAQIPIAQLLQTAPEILVYSPEPQGEAIGFAVDKSGYYTLSEQRGGTKPFLYFYKRKDL